VYYLQGYLMEILETIWEDFIHRRGFVCSINIRTVQKYSLEFILAILQIGYFRNQNKRNALEHFGDLGFEAKKWRLKAEY